MSNEQVVFVAKKQILADLFIKGLISAHYAHKTIFESIYSDDQKPPLAVALAYLTEAHNLFTTAETFYKDNEPIFGERSEISETIHKFQVFNKELLTNVRTEHSHQWTDIEFRAFVESFKTVSSLLQIENCDYWIEQSLKED